MLFVLPGFCAAFGKLYHGCLWCLQLCGSFCCSPVSWLWEGSPLTSPLRKTSSCPSLDHPPTLLGWILALKTTSYSSQIRQRTLSTNRKWMEQVSITSSSGALFIVAPVDDVFHSRGLNTWFSQAHIGSKGRDWWSRLVLTRGGNRQEHRQL